MQTLHRISQRAHQLQGGECGREGADEEGNREVSAAAGEIHSKGREEDLGEG